MTVGCSYQNGYSSPSSALHWSTLRWQAVLSSSGTHLSSHAFWLAVDREIHSTNEVKEAFELAEKIGLRQSVFRTRRRPVDAENVGSLFTLGQAELHALVRGHFKGQANNTGTNCRAERDNDSSCPRRIPLVGRTGACIRQE